MQNVAALAAEFAKPFGGEKWARIAGGNHDLGKETDRWQAWLRHVNGVIDDFFRYFNRDFNQADYREKWLFNHSDQGGKLLVPENKLEKV